MTTGRRSPELITYLARIVAAGGNLLLNVGPKGDGTFPEEANERLHAIGEWIATNEEAVRGIVQPPEHVRATLPVGSKADDQGERLFVYCIMRPWDAITLAGIPVNRIDDVRVVGTQESLTFTTAASLPEVHRGAVDPLGELEIRIPSHVADSFMPVIAVHIRPA